MAKLVIQYGSKTEKIVELDIAELIIGRGNDAQLVIDNPVVSRAHCKVVLHGVRHGVIDLGSKTGTFVNGKRITKQLLEDGDTIELGKHTLKYERSALESGQVAGDGSAGNPFADSPWAAAGMSGAHRQGGMRHGAEKGSGPVESAAASEIASLAGEARMAAHEGTLMASGDELKRVREALLVAQSPHLAVVGKGKKELVKLEKNATHVGHTEDADFRLPGSRWFGKRAFVVRKVRTDFVLETLSFWSAVWVDGERIKGSVTLRNGVTIETGGFTFRVGGL